MAGDRPLFPVLENAVSARPQPSNAPFLASRLSVETLRLTAEEWALIVGALRAYRHHNTYRPLYEKFASRTA